MTAVDIPFGSEYKYTPGPRSVSQINQYFRCPYQYKLARVDKVWQRPAAWLPQGSAVHEALEAWEKSGRTMTLEEAQDVFRESYQKYTNAQCEKTPNWEWWFKSGPYGGFEDTERRYDIGLEQVEKLMRWCLEHPNEQVWVAPAVRDRACLIRPDQEHHIKDCGCTPPTPAIELSFVIDVGGIPVRGFIDLVVMIDGEIRVRDLKTGNQPGDDFQLGVYALAIRKLYGVEVWSGDYMMAGKKGKPGKPTYPYDLTEWTEEAVTEKFLELEEKLKAGEFPADPEPSKCNFCDVNSSCDFAVG